VASSKLGPLKSEDEADIEKTIIDAVGLLPRDLRLASLVFTWVKVHGGYVITEKLAKVAKAASLENEEWLSAIAAFACHNKYHKGSKLVRQRKNPVHLLPREISEAPVRMRGAEPWLEARGLLLPKGSLRIREDDVLSPAELIRENRQYRNRYHYGPSWRADIITAIEWGCTSPTEIKQRIGCSYEPAHRVLREYELATSRRIA
jgi:hypothetical protein